MHDQSRNKGNRRRAAIVLLLAIVQVLTWIPIIASGGPSRDPAFAAIGTLPATEEYDQHSGQYSGFFPFLVSNSGPTTGSGIVSVTGLPAGWTWDIVEGPSILLDVLPGTVLRVTVHVQASRPMPGLHPFQAVIEPGPAIFSFGSQVPFLGALELSTTSSVRGGATSVAMAQATVKNLANGPDRFELTVYLPSSDWWSTIEGSPMSPELAVHSSFSWNISVHVPYSAEATPDGAAGYRVWFKVISQGDPTVNGMNQTQISVDAYRSIHLDVKESFYTSLGPSSVVTVEAILENDGNAPETLNISVEPPTGWAVQVPHPLRELASFERITIAVYISPSPNALTGNYGVSLLVKTLDGKLEDRTSTIVAVPARNALSLSDIVQDGPDPAPGQDTSYHLTVHNNGNHVELVELYPINVPSGWIATVTPSVLSFTEWGQAEAHLWVHTGQDPMASLEGPHNFGVFARSLFSGATASLLVQVHVRGVADMELFCELPVKEANPILDPDPVYIFRLRNNGNVKFVASLQFSSAEGYASWLQVSRQAVSVAPGDVATFHAAVAAPGEAVAGGYSYMVTATTKDGGGASMRADFLFTVLETNIEVLGLQGRAAGMAQWSLGPELRADQDLEAIAWLDDIGTDHAGTVELSFYIDGRYISSARTFGSPPGGASWGVPFKARMVQGWHNLTIRASALGEKDTLHNEASMNVHVSGAPVPVRETAAAAGFGITTSSIIFAAILLNETWKFKALLMFVVPLYTRLRPEATLDNFTRGRIYGYVEANPGEHYNAIKKALELPNGSLAHHLDMLIRKGFVRFESDGNYKRFYPSKMRLRQDKMATEESGRMTRIQQIILEAVREEPGISQREISRVLNLSPSTINYHIRLMATSGVLRLERSLGRTRCQLGDKAPPEAEDKDATVEEDFNA